ncbi:hypothetical protein [Streptomyces vinaceus]|uniref:hypothetical protein n=1 Tax=Streptomyces vinaceus TaxID=1960 RepID=UPI0038286D5F
MTVRAVHLPDETFALHTTGRAFEEVRDIVEVPSSRQEIPDLFVAADQLQESAVPFTPRTRRAPGHA